jgi:hypothetical protein
MRRGFLAVLACLLLVVSATPAVALRIMIPQSITQRIGWYDAAVDGKVTAIEAKTVKTERFVNDKEGGEYIVAVVKINNGYIGTKGLTHIKVAFPPAPPVPAPDQPIRPIRPIRPGFAPPKLEKDQEAILLLRKHHKEEFYVLQANTDIIDKKNADYAKSSAELVKISKAFSDPMSALKAKDANDRFIAASALLMRYKSQRPGATNQEAVPAEESKLILLALAGADWTKPVRPGELTPQVAFYQLQLQPTDGWMQPANFQEIPAAMQKWLKDHAESFKLMRFVAEK